MKKTIIFISVIILSLILPLKASEAQVASPSATPIPVGTVAKTTPLPTPIQAVVSTTVAPTQSIAPPQQVIQPTLTPIPVPANVVQQVPQTEKLKSNPIQPQVAAVQIIKNPQAVSVNNYPTSNKIAAPISIIKPPGIFFIPSNSGNFYPSEGLSTRNTLLFVMTGFLFIGIGNYLIKHSRSEAFHRKVNERIFYDWA